MEKPKDREIQVVKVILPGHKCPHCDKEILVSTVMYTPAIEWILRPEDIEAVKNKVKKHIQELGGDSDEKKKLEEWLDSPSTLISPDEVEQVKSQLGKSLDAS